MAAFEKRDGTRPEGFFEAEAAGLEWLAAADGARVVGVLDVAPGRIARTVGSLDADGLTRVEAVCYRIADGELDDDEAPARIHGDLWAGNVLWDAAGAVLIDPAAHGGHRETDLAMLQLFGLPHLDDVLGAYDAEAPLRAGWRDRVPLHQLHPLAVHAAGHGPSYGRALVRAAEETLALL